MKPLGDTDPRVIACAKAKRVFGSQGLADMLGHTRQGIDKWKMVPPTHVIFVERATGVSRYELRPDVFGTVEENVLLLDIAAAARTALNSIALADKLGVSLDELAGWNQVPAERCREVERLTGISRYVLRPDVFGEQPEPPSIRATHTHKHFNDNPAQEAATTPA